MTNALTSEATNPRFFTVYAAGLGFSSTTGNICLHLSTVTLHNLPFGARSARPRVTNIYARVVAAGEFLITDVSARNTLGDTGLRGGNIRTLVREDLTTTVTRNLGCDLTRRARPRMTEYGARMTACS